MIAIKNKIPSSLPEIIAQAYITYCKYMPNHKGRYRFAKILDYIFNSFELRTPSGPILEIFLSSSMDLSYYNTDVNISHLNILKIIHSIQEGDLFIDIGANIGFYAILASKFVGRSGRAICFEPSPREFRRLLKNVELNKVTNLLPYNIALSDYVGESKFVIAESHTGLNFLSNNSQKNCVLVPVCTGDSLLQYLKKETKKIIKIDVEGAEYFVISGMKNLLKTQNIEVVIVEITPEFLARFGHTKDMVYELMTECGFTPTIQSTAWQYDEIFYYSKNS